jgi:hypothetical protein
MTTLDDFKRLLNANPENTDTLLILADWLDDGNGLYGAGYRAMGVLRLYPYHFSATKAQCWGFINADGRLHNSQMPCNQLPVDWFDRIEETRHVIPSSYYTHPRHNWHTPVGNDRYGPFLLFKAAAKAFCKLPVERQQELLGLVTS